MHGFAEVLRRKINAPAFEPLADDKTCARARDDDATQGAEKGGGFDC